MDQLKEMGEFVRSASSTIEPAVVRRLTTTFKERDLPDAIRLAIVNRQFDQADNQLSELREIKSDYWEPLQQEIGQLIGQRHAHGGAGQRRIEWLTGLWAVTADSIASQPSQPNTADEERQLEAVQDRHSLGYGRPQAGMPRPDKPRPEALGRELEDGFVGVLTALFRLSKNQRVHIRKQSGGTQFGHDIEFEAYDARSGIVLCHVECKNHAEKVGISDIAPKVLQQLVYWENKPLDYFILIAPKAKATNELSRLVQDCNYGRKLPFQVLIWSFDQGVEELFRLTPRLYRTLYQRPAPKQTAQSAAEIARRWEELLQPTMRLPNSWQRYLTKPSLHQVYGETDFESVRYDAIALGALTDSGAPIPGMLHDNVREWLTNRPEKTLLLLAEFGDGKSFFGYELGLRLAAEFLDDPASGWVALRIPLRSLQENSQPSTLLQNRLDTIGVTQAEWVAISQAHKTLVILDGFDEMSARLDPQTLACNIDVLVQCIEHFPNSKVLVSSRTHFFEHLSDYEQFLEVLGNPRLLRIAPIPLRQRLDHLEAYASRIGEETKFAKLKTLYDPIGLAAKPLFLQMIKDTLPTLPADHFNEVVLYEQYIRDSLKRKALDLQPTRHLGEDRLVKNLTVILEELAVQLHMSRTDYVNLRDFDTGRREGLSEILWAMSGAPPDNSVDSTPDVRSRVGVRSLLKSVAGVDPELWPVDFFHRSMREFFVARAVVRAVTAQSEQAKTMLAHVPLQPEIVDFVRLLMRHPMGINRTDPPETLTHKLVSLAKSAIVPIYTNKHLGGNAVTLLFALNRKLPRTDWSGLALDYADLTGADLDGLSFRGSSLRNASLDNASLVGTDLRDADLTGVQLEQTVPVLTLTFDPDSNTAYAAYGDRTIRRWTFGAGGRMSCTTLAELDFQPTNLNLSPFGDLLVKGPDTIAVLTALGAEEKWRVVSRFPTNAATDALSINGNHITLRGKDPAGSPLFQRYDPIERKVVGTAAADVGSRLVLLDETTMLTATDNLLLLFNRQNQRTFEVPQLTSLDSRRINDDQVLLALGHEDGAVSLWRLHSLISQAKLEKIWQRDVHAGSVTDVRLSGMFVLSGGMDRTLCLFTLSDNWSTGEPLRLHRTLECAGIKIDGVRGRKEKALLESLIRAAAARPGVAVTPTHRPVPTPADVFGRRRRR